MSLHPPFNSKLRARVVGRNLADLLPLLEHFPVEILPEGDSSATADVVISYGGDGSLLGAEQLYPGVPKFALRDRRNNPKCPKHDEKQLLEAFFKGDLPSRQLMKLTVLREYDGTTLSGINDIVLCRQKPVSAIRCRIHQDGQLLCSQVISDGLVIATPFGSTGYFQSITRGNFQQGIGIAYNNPIDGKTFDLLPEHSRLDIELLRGPALLSADNNPRLIELQEGEHVTLYSEQQRTQLYGLEALRCAECYHLRAHGCR